MLKNYSVFNIIKIHSFFRFCIFIFSKMRFIVPTFVKFLFFTSEIINYFISFSADIIFSIPFKSASGLKEMLSIPSSTKNFAYSGKSLGA
jgi:hypothetical protein